MMALLCKRYRCLPSQLRREDFGEIMQMCEAVGLYDDARRYQQSGGKHISGALAKYFASLGG